MILIPRENIKGNVDCGYKSSTQAFHLTHSRYKTQKAPRMTEIFRLLMEIKVLGFNEMNEKISWLFVLTWGESRDDSLTAASFTPHAAAT